jgi:predicted ABC-type transport system involved in lysophospholipase L1 biosynthesis ATPase subunit
MSDTTRAEADFEAAIAAADAGRLDAARTAIRRAVSGFARADGPHAPDTANSRVEHARILLACGEPAQARTELGRATESLARIRIDRGQLAPLRADAWLLAARAERELGRYDAARRAGQQALRHARRSGDRLVAHAHNELGVIAKFAGAFAAAERHYRAESSLAMVIAGLRAPRSGAVFLGGLDRQTLGGEAWARRVVLVPQLHDNHVLSASMGFNLLIGRAWPPRRDDFTQAREICAELGLADLLARMPGGLEQQVGETGWQLSHGERARLFLARALLQRPDVLILDETLDSIDPPTREPVLRAILARVPIVIAIEHV